MNKYIPYAILTLCVVAFFAWGWMVFEGEHSNVDAKAEHYIVKEATLVASKYHIQQKEEVIVYDHELIEDEKIIMWGYLKTNPEVKRDVIVSYGKGFRVISDTSKTSP